MNRRTHTMSLTVIRLEQMFALRGAVHHAHEPATQLGHAPQCTLPADSEGAGDEPLSTVDHRLERAGRCARAQ